MVIRLALIPAVLLAVVPLGAAAPAALPLVACTLQGGVQARCGTFTVLEDRARPDGATISLRIAVVSARSGVAQRDPIVHITGGPGGSAIADAAGVASIFSGANATRDIVLVDQRGTGGSNSLRCPVPRKRLTTRAHVQTYVRTCLARLEEDPRQYGTLAAMDDLAEALQALGYDQVNVYGVSYGATAAQYFLVQHPELVRTVILDGGTLLDVPIFELWGRNGERALRAVLARCAASSRCVAAYPQVRREAFEVMAALRRKPVQVQGAVIDAAAMAGVLHRLTLMPADAAQIPWIAHRARVGDFVPLALTIDRLGAGALSLATRQVMFWSIVCNEPWARWNPTRAARASRGTYLAERAAMDARLVSAACSVVPKVEQPAWSRARVSSDKPVLLVVGGADPQDPPANVAGAKRELPNSRTVVVPGAGHTSVQLGCLPRIARQFIERGSAGGLDTRCAARYAAPPFVVR